MLLKVKTCQIVQKINIILTFYSYINCYKYRLSIFLNCNFIGGKWKNFVYIYKSQFISN